MPCEIDFIYIGLLSNRLFHRIQNLLLPCPIPCKKLIIFPFPIWKFHLKKILRNLRSRPFEFEYRSESHIKYYFNKKGNIGIWPFSKTWGQPWIQYRQQKSYCHQTNTWSGFIWVQHLQGKFYNLYKVKAEWSNTHGWILWLKANDLCNFDLKKT